MYKHVYIHIYIYTYMSGSHSLCLSIYIYYICMIFESIYMLNGWSPRSRAAC